MRELLKLEGVNFSYDKLNSNVSAFSLRNISLNINEGDFLSIIGTNGSGKSTLVKLISRILVSYSGKIFFSDKSISQIDRKEFSRNVAYLPQTTTTYNEDLQVEEFLLLGRYAHKKFSDFVYSKEDLVVVNESMKCTGAAAYKGTKLSQLSGGEKQKVLLTLALVQLDITKSLNAKVLVIDEPITYLDINHQLEIFNILKDLNGNGLTVIVVIHDLNLALRFSRRTILINNGEIIRDGISSDVINEEILRQYFRIESKIHNLDNNYIIAYGQNLI